VHIQVDLKEQSANTACYSMEIGQGARPGTYQFDVQAIDRNLDPVYLAGTRKKGKGEVPSVTITVK
jgi:hypothetical protein